MKGTHGAATAGATAFVATEPADRVHILLVDDDPNVLRTFTRCLERAGPLAAVATEIHTADSSERAVEVAAALTDGAERIACCLVDFCIGDGVDGIDTTLRLWQIDPDIQCTLVTGAAGLGDAETRQRIPGPFLDRWDFLAKPAGHFELVQRVRRSLITWVAARREESRNRENLMLVERLSRMNQELEQTVQARTSALAARAAELQGKNEELHLALRNLEAAQSQLLQQEKMASIGQLAAGVAHELNNPIGFVHSNLETLKRYFARIEQMFAAYEARLDTADEELEFLKRDLKIGFLRQDIPQLMAESIDGTDRIRRIVGDLRVFSHPPSKEIECADLNSGLRSTLNIVNNELKFKAALVTSYGAIPRVRCRLDEISQVFMNVLVNAAQAIEGFGEIRIATAQDGEDVVVTISDNGPGMTPDVLARIFDPFFTTKQVGQGTGLGLSISYDIVRKHGGSLTAESEAGKGTTFVVRLPIDGREDPNGK